MNVHRCDHCGWETRAPDHVVQVFHPCRPAERRTRLRRVQLPEVEGITRDEARQIGSPIVGAFEAAGPEDDRYRRVDHD